jgi:hypothetical protein
VAKFVRTSRSVLAVILAVLVHPRLWRAAVIQARVLAPNGWWRQWPPVPLPSAQYRSFRVLTAYGGDGDAVPNAHEVVTYLEWCRQYGGLFTG